MYSATVTADSTGTGNAAIFLSALPDSAEYFINGLPRTADERGGFTVEAGPVLFEIKRMKVIVFSTLFMLAPNEQHRIDIDCIDECALLHVMTEPPGAIVSINGNIAGTTPFMDRFIRPGGLSIMVTSPGFIPIIRRLELRSDSSEVFSFQMERTQAVKDSIAAVRRALRRKRQTILSSAFGGFGAAVLLAGGYFDYQAYQHLKAAKDASDRYDAARSDAECREAKMEYLNRRERAEKPILYRNALYGVAAACLVGFYLSFVF